MPGPHVTTSPCEEYAVAIIGTPYGDDETCPRAFYIGANGDLTLEDMYGNTVTFYNVVAGTVLPIAARQVVAAPANLVALF